MKFFFDVKKKKRLGKVEGFDLGLRREQIRNYAFVLKVIFVAEIK